MYLAKPLGDLSILSSFFRDYLGLGKMQEFLKTKRDLQGRCGIYFTFIYLCGLLVPMPLEGFLFQFYILIG